MRLILRRCRPKYSVSVIRTMPVEVLVCLSGSHAGDPEQRNPPEMVPCRYLGLSFAVSGLSASSSAKYLGVSNIAGAYRATGVIERRIQVAKRKTDRVEVLSRMTTGASKLKVKRLWGLRSSQA